MNTAIRLMVLIPALVICPFVAAGLLGFGLGEFQLVPTVLAIVIAVAPFVLIAWTLSDHRKRHRKDSR
jgi:high-affinity Fe2+/Pb2+ permease